MQTFAAILLSGCVYKYVSAINAGKKKENDNEEEIKIMNTNTMELNMNEMEQINGGIRPKSNNRNVQQIANKWLTNTVAPTAIAVGNGACLIGKVVCNWVAGLFD